MQKAAILYESPTNHLNEKNITAKKNRTINKAIRKVTQTLVKKYGLSNNEAQRRALHYLDNAKDILNAQHSFNKYPDVGMFKDYIDIAKKVELVDKHFYAYFITFSSVLMYQSFGDTIGYHNGLWEFNYNKKVGAEYANELLYEFISLGGINNISMVNWRASDDTLMYLATFVILMADNKNIYMYGERLQKAYINLIPQMMDRHPGNTVLRALEIQKNIKWDTLQYDREAIGAGASMRSGCIGLFYSGKHNRKKLVALAVETSRITHNSATAILGSIVAALFTAYAIEKVDIKYWPHKMLRLLKKQSPINIIDSYIRKSRPHEYNLYSTDKVIFIGQWEKYINMRFSGTVPRFDMKTLTNIVTRYTYFADNFSKGHTDNAGSCSDDSVIMAYDSLLESGGVLEKIVIYSALHPGDSDTVACIAMSWFGAYYHSHKNISLMKTRFTQLEFYDDFIHCCFNSGLKMIKFFYYDLLINICKKNIKKDYIHYRSKINM